MTTTIASLTLLCRRVAGARTVISKSLFVNVTFPSVETITFTFFTILFCRFVGHTRYFGLHAPQWTQCAIE